MRRFTFVFLFLLAGFAGQSQKVAARWASLFHLPFDGLHTATEVLWDSVGSSPVARQVIAQLEADEVLNEAGRIRLALLKIRYWRRFGAAYDATPWRTLGADAVRRAVLLQDDYLLQSACSILGDACLVQNISDTAIFYLLKSCALSEQLGYQPAVIANEKIATSNVLYRTQNYAQCIAFCKSVSGFEEQLTPIAVVTAYNNTGLGYLKLGQPDSALFYFQKGLAFCRKKRWGIWEGIMSGNAGDALHAKGQHDEAVRHWQTDYDSSLRYRELSNAGLTLAYLSEHAFNNGKRQTAIEQLHWAVAVNGNDGANLERIYAVKASCYRKLGMHDSADWYWAQHYRLTDSINRAAGRQNFSTVQLRLGYEATGHQYQLLKQERQTEIIRRNLLLVALASSLLIGWLLFNRQRLKTRLARQQRVLALKEAESANEQLALYTQLLLEKNSQIETLHASLVQQATDNNEELVQQTLLTDYDWNRFKVLFEKTHLEFFARLKNLAPAITQSEMRLAALIKLNLDNKQMASMQGISVSSLRGNKTRLRQKLNLPPDADLEETVRAL